MNYIILRYGVLGNIKRTLRDPLRLNDMRNIPAYNKHRVLVSLSKVLKSREKIQEINK